MTDLGPTYLQMAEPHLGSEVLKPTDGAPESSGGHGAGELPVMPGPEKPLLHIAIEFVEMLDNALAEHQMLNVAHGELPAVL